MKQIGFISIIGLFIILAAGVITAQDEEPRCTVEDYQEFMDALSTNALAIKEQIVTEQDGVNALLGFGLVVNTLQATCGGGMYSSDSHENGIIGPIAFSGTLYQAELVSEAGYASLGITEIEGDCGFNNMFTESGGGTETDLWEFEGCTAMIEVNAPDGWTLNLSRLQ